MAPPTSTTAASTKKSPLRQKKKISKTKNKVKNNKLGSDNKPRSSKRKEKNKKKQNGTTNNTSLDNKEVGFPQNKQKKKQLVENDIVQWPNSTQQLDFFINQYKSNNGIKLSSLELDSLKEIRIVELSPGSDKSTSGNLGEHVKVAFGSSWKKDLCEKHLVEGQVDPGNPAILVISSSAIRALELLREMRPLTKECHAAKLFSKHMKIEEQVRMLKERVNIASGTPSRIKKLIEMEALGNGVTVRRAIGRLGLKTLDPFILLEEFSVSPTAGFPDHPHRGFENVTYVFQGGIKYEDFEGRKCIVHAGEVQWLTAGKGIVHSEMPIGEEHTTGLQLMINLSSKDKMMEPRYQELVNGHIPRAENNGVEVKVIAGEALGVQSHVYTQTPTMYLDFTLKPNAQHHQGIPQSWNAFVYTLEGKGVFGTPSSPCVEAHHILVLGPGEGLSVWNQSSGPLRFVLVGGQPLNEPVVMRGPFVMNTKAEIDQTIEDYKCGKNGFEMAKGWSSK